MRQLHPTQYGYVCPSETPEGKGAGVTKAIAFLASFSRASSSELVTETLETFAGDDVAFVNGALFPTKVNAFRVRDELVRARRNGNLPVCCSFTKKLT